MPEVTPSEPFALFDGDDGSGLLLSGYCRAVFLDPEAQGGDALGAAFSALEDAGRDDRVGAVLLSSAVARVSTP